MLNQNKLIIIIIINLLILNHNFFYTHNKWRLKICRRVLLNKQKMLETGTIKFPPKTWEEVRKKKKANLGRGVLQYLEAKVEHKFSPESVTADAITIFFFFFSATKTVECLLSSLQLIKREKLADRSERG